MHFVACPHRSAFAGHQWGARSRPGRFLVPAVLLVIVLMVFPPAATAHAKLALGSAPAPGRTPMNPSDRIGELRHVEGGPSVGVPALTWRNATNESPTSPPVTWFTGGTWDTADGYLLSYGGDNFGTSVWNSTVTFEGGTWGTVPTNDSIPGPLDGPSLAYDPADRSVVMYGGYSSYSPFQYSNATFTFSGGHWTAAELHPTPPAPTSAAMAYDPELGGVVMFGGYNNSASSGNSVLNDLWLYKNGTWSALPNLRPPTARTWASMSFDPSRHELVMYGGVTASYACFGETWTYNGSWQKVIPEMGAPGGFYGTQMAYDPDVAGVVLTGGRTCTGNAANYGTWVFNGTTWVALNASGTPSAHLYGILAWDPVDGVLVESGGNPQGQYTDVLSTPLRIVNATAPAAGDLGEALPFGVNVAGGVPSRNIVWNWGDLSPDGYGGNATHSYAATGIYPVTVRVDDDAGGTTSWSTNISIEPSVQVEISTTFLTLEVGVNATFLAESSGGTGPFSYSWTFGDGGTALGPEVEHDYASVGSFRVGLSTRDAIGGSNQSSLGVTVVGRLQVAVQSGSFLEVGVPSEFSSAVAGGVPPYQCSWQLDGRGAGTAHAANLTFAIDGPHSVTAEIQDAEGVTTNATVVVQVASSLGARIGGPRSAVPGAVGQWTVALSGGIGPYTVNWTASNGARGNESAVAITFASPGAYTLVAYAKDAGNGTATTEFNITVEAAATPSSSASVPLIEWVGVGLVAALVVGAAVVWLRRRR